jgi:hypothetical protein
VAGTLSILYKQHFKKFRWEKGNFWRKKQKNDKKKIAAIDFLMQQIFGSIFVI